MRYPLATLLPIIGLLLLAYGAHASLTSMDKKIHALRSKHSAARLASKRALATSESGGGPSGGSTIHFSNPKAKCTVSSSEYAPIEIMIYISAVPVNDSLSRGRKGYPRRRLRCGRLLGGSDSHLWCKKRDAPAVLLVLPFEGCGSC